MPRRCNGSSIHISSESGDEIAAPLATVLRVVARSGPIERLAMGERPLTLLAISDELLAEYGLRGNRPRRDHYRCDDAGVDYVHLARVIAPIGRALSEAVTRRLLADIRDDAALPAVLVVAEPATDQVRLLNGLHRYLVSLACGFRSIPCRYGSTEEAREAGAPI